MKTASLMSVLLVLFFCSVCEALAGDAPVSFRRDVMPVFLRATCNSGGCHGAASGKDGFRLSLFGYDPEGDYFRLTQQIVGRRINTAAPARSLILLKATNAVPHTGGKLFDEKSEYYAAVLRWIQQGAPDNAGNVAQAMSIALEPSKLLFDKDRAPRELRVIATYSDGAKRDVTRLSLYASNNKSVADIDENGKVKAGGRGATDVFARFDKYTIGAEVVVLPEKDEFAWPAHAQPVNYIDNLVHTRLQQLRIVPSDLCTDEEFLRRVTFDITGLPPTENEYRHFMADTAADKRAKLAQTLLERPAYAELWATKWAGWLKLIGDTNSGGGFDHKAALAYFQWITAQFQRNTPLDQFVRAQVAGRGSNFLQPEVNLYTMLPAGDFQAKAVAQDVAQVFTGMRIQCAECHNHPFDRWTQNDYYSFVSFFTGLRRKMASEPREFYIYNDNSAPPAVHLLDQRPMPPKFLGGAMPDTAGKDPREALAAWLTSPENSFFARNMANRIWAQFFGRGIVEPLDDFRITNPPSNASLLDELGHRLAGYGFDQKRLICDIVNSRAYQLSSHVNSTNRADDRQISHAPIRRLPAPVALDAIASVTGVETHFRSLPPGQRSMQIYESGRRRGDYFLSAFGQSERKTVCAADEITDPSFSQALHLINGDTVLGKLHSSTVVSEALKEKLTPPQLVERLFIRTLCRKPSPAELAKFTEISGAAPKPSDYANLWWALLNSTDFLFQH